MIIDELVRNLRQKGYRDAQILDIGIDEGFEEEEVQAALAKLAPSMPPPSRRPQPRSGGTRDNRDDLLRAPYRFVTLNEAVLPGAPPAWGTPLSDGLCATIAVRWVAETPLLIGEERKEGEREWVGPMRLWDGPGAPYTVPGSSLRGMLRSALEIVAFGRLHRVNAHHRYGLRDFEHPTYRDGDFPLSDVDKVQAGWLRKTGEGYEITPCQWSQIMIEEMRGAGDPFQWTNTPLDKKYDQFGMGGFDFTRTHRFEMAEKHNNKETLRLSPNGSIEGVLVFSDKVPNNRPETWRRSGKKVEYVFHGPNGKAEPLLSETWAQFRRSNSKPSKNKSEPVGSWKKLENVVEKQGKAIPVFYVGDLHDQTNGFAFGLTRLFKVPHAHSVKVLIARSQKARPKATEKTSSGFDFVESLFGYVLEGDTFDYEGEPAKRPNALARKGRVAFGFGTFGDDCAVEQEQAVETVMMGPRASFAPFYLSGQFKDYSDPKATVAGRKRYLPRYPGGTNAAPLQRALERQLPTEGKVKDNDKIRTRLKFLVPKDRRDLTFTSEIRLHNVSKVELGAVLWVLTHGGETARYRHMLGRAKAFGAGQLRVAEARLAVTPNAQPPSSPAAEHDEYLTAFEAAMVAQIPGWRRSDQVLEFLGTSDPMQGKELADRGRLEYLSEVKDFGAIRKMTKMDAGGKPPCPPFGRYLVTPKSED